MTRGALPPSGHRARPWGDARRYRSRYPGRYRRRPGDAVTLGVGMVALVVSGLVAAGGVPGWESDLFHALNGLPDRLEGTATVLQLGGVMGVPLAAAALAAARRRWRLALALTGLVPIKLFLEHEVVKRLVERPRPAVSLCGGDLSCAHFRDAPLSGLAFVSGHAVILGGLAGLVVPYLGRRARVAVLGVAVTALAGRVYLGAHLPLDVVGGAGLGAAVAAALNLALGVPAEPGTDGPAGAG